MLIDIASASTEWTDVYRLCLSFINPRPIALVSTISPKGEHNLAPFSFYNMVSANPPVVIFAPGRKRDGTSKDTLINIEAIGEFAIATVTHEIRQKMSDCAANLPYGQSEYEFSGLTPAPAAFIKPPLVKEAKINIECRLRQIVSLGDQHGAGCVVFGDIVALHVDEEVLDESRTVCDPFKLRTVGRLGGSWYCTVESPYPLTIPKAPF